MTSQNHKHNKKKIYAREFHAVQDNGTILAFDVENIRLIQIDDLELRVLKHIKEIPASISALKKRFSAQNGENIKEAVNDLMNVNMLDYSPFEKTCEREVKAFERNHLENFKKNSIRHIALNVTHKCNLNCDYCYGGDSYGGPAIHMSKDTAKQAVDFLMKVSENAENCRITFFGGEPLLNLDLVKYVVQYARKEAAAHNKKIYFGMTTNGVLLDEDKSDFLIDEKIDMTFSIDGPKGIHDMARRFKSNQEKSSFDIIYPQILKFIDKAKKNSTFYCFRATLTRPGILNIYEVVDFFNGLNSEEVHYDFAEYKDNISANGLSVTEEDLIGLRRKLKDAAKEFKKSELKPQYDSFFSGPLNAIRERKKRQCSCISPGNLYIGVSAQGDIFPCHRFVACKETRLGNIWEGFNREKWLEKYARVHIFNSTVCSACWIRYFCGGMCAAANYYLCSDLVLTPNVHPEPVHCQLKKIVFEEAMVLYARLSREYHETKEEVQGEERYSAPC
jgi:uncharacterized protein